MMHIIIFEDILASQLFPATIGKAAFSINVGSYSLIDLAMRFSGSVEVLVRPYLRSKVNFDYPGLWSIDRGERLDTVLVLNARVVPHVVMLCKLRRMIEGGQVGVVSDERGIACAVFNRQNPLPAGNLGVSQLSGIIADMNLPQLDINIPMMEYAHDIVRFQQLIMNDNLADRISGGDYREVADGVFVAGESPLGQFCATDTRSGPIIFEAGVSVGHCSCFRGPVYVGANSRINEMTSLKDAVTLCHTTKVGGEVEAAIIEAYSNKQHHGFLGHSYLGSWINLGAGTCNSDLKNTYGEVVMEYSNRKVKTGMQFVGCFIGDYAKTAINTSIFTGKTIGACSMAYGFVTTNVPSFVNYARSFGQVTETSIETLVQTQARMFARRGVIQRPCDVQLLKDIYEMTKHERQLASEPLSL
ncbi:MAG: hypothetical protein LBP59_10210 [Planctomycetaceae bacterium]|jgi:glucose-1-phosphate thymidylyltransferase|nr:hypothetical protein [Planctomycetaceae bacterium]